MSNGSETAKRGFRNEEVIAEKFNNWINDSDAKEWLEIIGYALKDIESVRAIKISGKKADIQVQIDIQIKLKRAIGIENIQIKLVSNKTGFNQIDKRWLKEYKRMWDMPLEVYEILQLYCGEKKPIIPNTKDKRRMFLNELPEKDQLKVLSFFNANKFLIVSDILRGRGAFAAEWILVVQRLETVKWLLISINEAINFYGNQDIYITKAGNIRMGKIGIQRKGGDSGKDTANMLQFKLDPIDMFEPYWRRIREIDTF